MLGGRVEHRTIDRLLKTHKERGDFDYLDLHEATAIFTEEWGIESGLYSQDLFTQGLKHISDLIDTLGPLDPERILATEKWFSTDLGDDVEVVGVIDLVLGVETFNEETGEVFLELEVIDWKTTKLFMSPTDAHQSMQLSLYVLAAKQMWPKATKVTAALHMLDSGSHLQTHRSGKALAEDILFIKSVSAQIWNDETWLPRLNSDCVHCHLRSSCSAYKHALTGPMPIVVEDVEGDLDALAEEREAVALRAKIAKKRQGEIDDLFKALLRASGQPLDLTDFFFRLSQVARKTYPAEETCRFLAERLGMEFSEVVAAICEIQKKKLDALFKGYEGPEDPRMVQGALANLERISYSSRLNSKKKKPNKKGAKK